MKIIHHERFRAASHFSIERLFAKIRAHLPPDCEARPCPCPFPSRGFWPRARNLEAVRRVAADVHHIVGDVHYLAFALPKVKTVLTIHDCAALQRLRGWRWAVLRYFWFAGPVRRAVVTTTISQATKAELRRFLGRAADQIEVVPDCVPDEFAFSPAPFNQAAPVVLQVGTKWNKNLERVAEALREIPCRLEVVGLLSAKQRQALDLARVDYLELGHLSDDDLLKAYRRCDCVVFASLYEGFGLPILEAQATGRPVITSQHGPMAEVAGDGALLIDPRSVESIRSAVNLLLTRSDLRAGLIDRGRKNAERFSADSVAAQYAAIYRRVAKSPAGHGGV